MADVFILGRETNEAVYGVASELRRRGISCEVSLSRPRAYPKVIYCFHTIRPRWLTLFGAVLVNPKVYSKLEQYTLLRAAGVRTPETAAVASMEALIRRSGEIGFPVVAKPLNGSHSEQVVILSPGRSAPTTFPVILQKYIAAGGECFRALVVGDRVEMVSKRTAWDGFRAAYGSGLLGSIAVNQTLSVEANELAVRAAAALFAHPVVGVDVLIDTDDTPWICEVNHRSLELTAPGMEGSTKKVALYLAGLATRPSKPKPKFSIYARAGRC